MAKQKLKQKVYGKAANWHISGLSKKMKDALIFVASFSFKRTATLLTNAMDSLAREMSEKGYGGITRIKQMIGRSSSMSDTMDDIKTYARKDAFLKKIYNGLKKSGEIVIINYKTAEKLPFQKPKERVRAQRKTRNYYRQLAMNLAQHYGIFVDEEIEYQIESSLGFLMATKASPVAADAYFSGLLMPGRF